MLIVYDTVYGNNERLCRFINDKLKPGEIITKNIEDTLPTDLHGTDVLILSSPTHNWQPTAAMLNLLSKVMQRDIRFKFAITLSTSLNQPQTPASIIMYNQIMPYCQQTYHDNFNVESEQGPFMDSEENHINRIITELSEIIAQ